jgi:hypothetical protein
MADINIERKRPSVVLILLIVVVVALVAWIGMRMLA